MRRRLRRLGKKLAESADEQKRLAEALRNADPKLKKELAENLDKLPPGDEEKRNRQPQGEQKSSDVIDELAKELAKQSDKGQPDDGSTKPGDPNPMGGNSGDGTNVRERPIGEDRSDRRKQGPFRSLTRNAARAANCCWKSSARKSIERCSKNSR